MTETTATTTRTEDGRAYLKTMTDARVALGRFGAGMPTAAAQAFLMDHARAREAVWSTVDQAALRGGLSPLGLDMVDVESLATDRGIYVRRPDLGRQLSPASVERLNACQKGADVVIVVGDGLSSSAVDVNAVALVTTLVKRLRDKGFSLAPLVMASQARVALGDPVGEILRARVSIILIGERPGLSAADSLGAYLTAAPRTGTADSRRNCISNIRDGGLTMDAAGEAITTLVADMIRTGVSGVTLRDALDRLTP